MKTEVTHRLKHIRVIAVCFVASFVITGMSCPFAGPSTGDALFFMLGIVLAGHVVVTLGSLLVPKFSWVSAAVIALLCLTPSLFFAGYAIKEEIHFRRYAVLDRFREKLADPIPESVKGLRFTTLEEKINPDLGFCFDIAAADLREIIASKGLQPTRPEDLRCPRDFFKYPYYLPVHGKYVLYQGSDEYGSVLTLKVNKPQTQAESTAIRQCIVRGNPFGDDTWTRSSVARLGLERTQRPPGRPKKQKNESCPFRPSVISNQMC